jgi:hypothetical protein
LKKIQYSIKFLAMIACFPMQQKQEKVLLRGDAAGVGWGGGARRQVVGGGAHRGARALLGLESLVRACEVLLQSREGDPEVSGGLGEELGPSHLGFRGADDALQFGGHAGFFLG